MDNDGNQIKTSHQKRALGWRLVWLAIAMLSLSALAAYTRHVDDQLNDRASANKIKSANNLRQIGLAIQTYSNGHGGAYPDTFGTLLVNEDITPAVFDSPGSDAMPATGPTIQALVADLAAGGNCSYVYLGHGLSGNVPSNAVVAYEDPAIWPDGANVLYGDGRVEFDDVHTVRQIAQKAAGGSFSVTMP
jgi:prepilin-type processing-associated H-X9-DG protein